jgi:hypothetical protein
MEVQHVAIRLTPRTLFAAVAASAALAAFPAGALGDSDPSASRR